MDVREVRSIFFSPTGNARLLATRLAQRIAELLGVAHARLDITAPSARESVRELAGDALAVFCLPVYAGKLPNKLLPYMKEGFAGAGTAAVALTTFGNRSFDNAPAELVQVLESSGFRVIAAGAFVGEHAFTDALAKGRPDAEDLAKLDAFADEIAALLRAEPLPEGRIATPGDACAPYYSPVGADGEPTVFLKAKPVTDEALCDGCGICARLCPMGSISFDDPRETPGICIKCHACVRGCPHAAKRFDDAAFLSHRAMLERDYTRCAENMRIVLGGDRG